MNKKLEKGLLEVITKKAYKTSFDAANSNCIFYAYQKERPAKVIKLKSN